MTNYTVKITIGILGCVALLWSLADAQNAKTYEIRPQIPESVFKNDSARALDAYERLIDRALELNQRQLDAMNLSLQEVNKQLTRIESKQDRLLNRTLLMEYALGMSQFEVKETFGEVKSEDPNSSNREK